MSSSIDRHNKLVKPTMGNYHRFELALIGAPCDRIELLTKRMAADMAHLLKIGYLDADHHPSQPYHDFAIKYRDAGQMHYVEYRSSTQSLAFQQLDLLLINGNHFEGKKQIVIINEKKRDSLAKKLDKLTDVAAFLLDENEVDIPDYLQPFIGDKQIITFRQIDQLSQLIYQLYQAQLPHVNGLILAGGKSERMGRDKTQIDYHGKTQVDYLEELLGGFCDEVFVAVRHTEAAHHIPDYFTELGPFGGILSAFRHNPNTAWLVAACDMPLIDKSAVHHLLANRKSTFDATCYLNPEKNWPEPLFAIWEPKGYPHWLYLLSQGISCPRKALMNSQIHTILPSNPEILHNVNTPDELRMILTKLQDK